MDYLVDVELIDTIISNLKKGRADAIDHLTAENLQFFHPAITTVLAKLFNIKLVNDIVPDSFAQVILSRYLNAISLENLYPTMILEAYLFFLSSFLALHPWLPQYIPSLIGSSIWF